MKEFNDKKVEIFFQDIQSISPDSHTTGMAIREIFFELNKKLNERIMYGGVMFFCNEEMMSGIFFYKAHISIEFGKGVEFTDLESVLEGKGKFRRHIKIHNFDEIQSKNVESFIQQAFDKQ